LAILAGKSRVSKILVLVVIFIIIGLVLHLLFVYIAASSLDYDIKSIDDIKQISTFDFEMTFTITLKNPTPTSIDIKKLTYDAYLENSYVGSGEKTSFTIHPGSEDYSFSLKFNIFNLTSAVIGAILMGSATLKLKMRSTVSVKFLGTLEMFDLTVDYVKEEELT
jgi:LEA14-like dessication related protein